MANFEELATKVELPAWQHTPEQILAQAKELIAKLKEFNDKIASEKNPTVDSVLYPTIAFDNENHFLENQLTFYQSVSTDKAVRDASTQAESLLDESIIEQESREDLYLVYQKLLDNVQDLTLDPEHHKFLVEKVKLFKRKGLGLPADKREAVKKLNLQLSSLCVEFGKSNNEENDSLQFSKEDLAGVPQTVFDQFEQVDGKFKVTYKYPDILPVLKYAKSGETRRKAYVGFQNRVPQNAELLEKIVHVRFELAKALGYETFSQYVLEERMAKTQEHVQLFLADLQKKLAPLGEKELGRMKELKTEFLKSEGLSPEPDYYAWDHAFFDNLLLEQHYQVDHQKIAEYFSLDETIRRMFAIYETLFALKFVPVEDKNKWHADVRTYAVFSGEELQGVLYLDLHPRDGKYTHAACFGLKASYSDANGNRVAPASALVCNFTKPTAEKPLLLKHSEVETFFHELGHGIHGLVLHTKTIKFSGTSVPRDFVECPSQMLEFWTWLPLELRGLSSHFETGEPLSDDLLNQLIASKHVNTGLANLRQLHFAQFDMALHSKATAAEMAELNLESLWNNLRAEVTLMGTGLEITRGYSSFGHLAGGYESGYYGYLYSQVFATDIYYTHFKQAPMDPKRGVQYRDTILRVGGTKEILTILEDLLGRPPNSEAFMQELLGTA